MVVSSITVGWRHYVLSEWDGNHRRSAKINVSLRQASLRLIDYLHCNDEPVARPLPMKHRCAAPRDRLALQSECLHQLVGERAGAFSKRQLGHRREKQPEIEQRPDLKSLSFLPSNKDRIIQKGETG